MEHYPLMTLAIQQTLSDIDASLLRRAKSGPIGLQRYHYYHAKKFLKLWASRRIDSITRGDVKRWIAERRTQVSDATVRHELAFLSRVFRTAIEMAHDAIDRGEEPAHSLRVNPCAGLTRGLASSRCEERCVTPDESGQLELAMDPLAWSVVRFEMLCGLRPLELFLLRPDDVDEVAHLITVRRSKTGCMRRIPLHPEAAEIAAAWKQLSPGAWLFYPEIENRPWAVTWFRRERFSPAVAAAGLPRTTMRHLRHTFASRIVRAGRPLQEVQVLLGHTNPKMTQRYAHLSMDNLRDAIGVL